MKASKLLLVYAGFAAIAFAAASCATHTTTVPLSNGFQAVAHPSHTFIDEPPPPRIALQRRASDGTITRIWPALYSTDTVIHGDLVLFVAEKAYREPEAVTHPRLFAARPPALPLDLTDEILWRWSKVNGRDFNTTLKKIESLTPVENAGQVEIHLDFWGPPLYGEVRDDWPASGILALDWQQIAELMRAVKTKGIVQKDLRWHTEYIGEKY